MNKAPPHLTEAADVISIICSLLRYDIWDVHIHARFPAMPKLMQAWFLVIWLNENVHFHARFLAMPKLMQAWFWSSGLRKTFYKFCFNADTQMFIFMLVFSPRHSRCKHRSALLA